MSDTVKMLDQEIQGCLESMNDLEAVNSEEYGDAVTNVTKLMDKLVELKKLDIEQSKLEQTKEIEFKKMEIEESKLEQMKEIETKKIEIDETKLEQMKEIETEKIDSENRDRLVKNVITVVTTGAGIVLTIWGTKKTFQFEETGSITSTAGRKYLDALLSKFKK